MELQPKAKFTALALSDFFWSSLAYDRKLSEQKQLENWYRLRCIQPLPKISGHKEAEELGRALEVRK